ncbi:hypothetical protein [Streptomyces sp. L2]|uniref:hypothetical protein n=1 Tax=Streptomyces sp. L2 TaxID=2162665 RepID=UPI0010113004|nr:hypothetical protein [Streptomyces sp. L2]
MAVRDGGVEPREYDGPDDALMAAITGDPLPEAVDAHPDETFRSAHHAAETDLAVLREHLTWIAEALTGETLRGEPQVGGARDEVPRERGARAGDPRDRGPRGAMPGGGGIRGAAGSAAERAAVAETGPVPETQSVPEAGSVRAEAGRGVPGVKSPRRGRDSRRRPAAPSRPGRPSGARRVLRVALGSVAGAAALGLLAGLGWLAAQGGGGPADGADAKSDSGARGGANGDGAAPDGKGVDLACARLVVEGSVVRVEPGADGADRVSVRVGHRYRPADGPAEVSFLLDAGADPAPRRGQHVLVSVPRGTDHANVWAVGDSRVAADRAWISDALSGPERASGQADCPS